MSEFKQNNSTLLSEHICTKKKEFFPNEEVKKTVVYMDVTDRSGVYTFKVSLTNGIWRNINISHHNYLSDLHLAIQKAFNFDNDHLYSFYIGGNRKRNMLR